jgi:hypothetical protein
MRDESDGAQIPHGRYRVDSMRHVRPEEAPSPSPLFGITIYRRENMPEGWPER